MYAIVGEKIISLIFNTIWNRVMLGVLTSDIPVYLKYGVTAKTINSSESQWQKKIIYNKQDMLPWQL